MILVKPNVFDNQRIVISIEVTAEAGFKIRVGPNQLPQYIADALQPSKEELFSKEVLQNFFTFIRNCNICSGFAVATNKVSRSQTGKTIGKPFMFKGITTAEPVQKHMSIDCEALIVQFTGNAKMCKNCSKIKHNCGKALNQTFTEETPFSKFKRESYMTNDEKSKKLQHVEKSLTLARQQTEYYKQKCLQIEMEMYELCQEDHDDINTILPNH